METIIQFMVTKDAGIYTADGVNISVVAEANTLEELQDNIRDAVALYFEGDGPASLGYGPSPPLPFLSTFSCFLLSMMETLKRLSGNEVADILTKFDFAVHSSNVINLKLRRYYILRKDTLVIPAHSPLAPKTLRAIYNQACRYVPHADLRPHFYIE